MQKKAQKINYLQMKSWKKGGGERGEKK